MAGLHIIKPEVIPQEEIDSLIGMENQLRNLNKMYDQACAAMLDRLLSGCTVEGGIHTAAVEVIQEGPRRITRLVTH